MLTAFDVGIGILVLISAILATARGLTREVLSLATWAGSAAIAIYMWQFHPEIARGYIQEQIVADVATVVVTFIISLIVLHLITMRIADFVVDSRIGPLDRTLGFVFGVLRGIVIGVVAVIFGVWLMGSNLPAWAANSKSLPILQGFGDSLIAALPPNLEEQVNAILKRGKGAVPTEDTAPVDEGTDAGEDDSPLPGTVTPPAPVTNQPANTPA
ncbi:colicin V biosynthesis protein [Youhaiella tibetensis]|uniref:CvpA family protein n=1 Tax=Paradevosia tibetensis TaxID=1447062 RepID=A0A5B9DP01_9HYPH|nr:CvpA family protein [Youhaiella tibetensis]AKR55137.1 Colicin V production protein [Devosia sp. H5989]QEE20228.1 CvpA family protein [Youhaiella tibetensis]GGF25990.1 colicin V biosynthesis protein [Youhaiella tibetensis]